MESKLLKAVTERTTPVSFKRYWMIEYLDENKIKYTLNEIGSIKSETKKIKYILDLIKQQQNLNDNDMAKLNASFSLKTRINTTKRQIKITTEIDRLIKNGEVVDGGVLIKTVKYGEPFILLKLISLGADVKIKKKYKTTLLIEAVKKLNIDMVKFLLRDCVVDINETDDEGMNALHYAAKHWNEDWDPDELIDLLIKNGADINAKIDGMNALHFAARYSLTNKGIDTLLKWGVGINDSDECGFTPLMLSAMFNPHPKVLKALIKGGAELEIKWGEFQNTPLMAVAALCNIKAVEILINAGADIKAKDKNGRIAFDYLSCSYVENAWQALSKAKRNKLQELLYVEN